MHKLDISVSFAGNQLINCRNHVLEFRKNMLRLKNESENHRQNLLQVLNQVKYEIAQTTNASGDFLERKVSRLSENEIRPNGFEGLKFFLPHLRTVERIYPDIATGRGKAGVSFALGITTIGRRNHTYLKQTLTSILSRMTPEEEKDSVVIISVADVSMGNEVPSSISVASKAPSSSLYPIML
ncbi:hypothetical protein U0070_009222 [Myodes glareolus]|uniref:MGAT4 conserved region domain-containing protein n=1 Tax=Myodes glareolus TaxID=447135 RepID=A0AAW0HIY7_MYOGA